MVRTRLLFAVLPLTLAAVACSNASDSDGSSEKQSLPPDEGSQLSEPGTGSSMTPSPGSPLPGEKYAEVKENDWIETSQTAASTFAADVDTASYTLMRRDILEKRVPNAAGIRPEEYLNYFKYSYPQPTDGKPFSVNIDAAPSFFGADPANAQAAVHLVRIGLQGKTIPAEQRAAANLVFLVDVSGSMAAANKLPLVQYTLKQLVKKLEPKDTLGIVTYAGFEQVLIPSTSVTTENKAKIIDAIDGLVSGGSTNGEGGIKKAYEVAEAGVAQNSTNRVILCTDGDFNVGLTGDALVSLIESERDKGITLTTLGFGEGNYNDKDMEALADHGNGNYAYIDNMGEANRVLGEKLVSTLQVIAKDVKIQVEFNPATVTKYRLIGYENRVMANEDFRNDAKDAGELGAGHSVTALYEAVFAPNAGADADVATVRLRYKEPDAIDTTPATEFSSALKVSSVLASFDAAPADFRFAAAAAELSEILRRSKHSTGARFDDVISIATATADGQADRTEMLTLVQSAKTIFK